MASLTACRTPLPPPPPHRAGCGTKLFRKAGFPRGHVLSSFGQPLPPPPGGGGEAPPLHSAPIKPRPSGSPRDGGTATTRSTAARAARGLVADVFCHAPDGSGRPGQQHQHAGGDGAHGAKGGPRVLPRAAAEARVVAVRKLPKRLRRAVPLFEEVVHRAHRCKFGRLLEAHCPLPASVRGAKAARHAAGQQAGRRAREPDKDSGMFDRSGRRGGWVGG